MPRKARIVIPNVAHHIVQRGNYQQYVFEKNEDFRIYLYLIRDHSRKCYLDIHAFCLMNNHIHFIITPKDKTGLSEMFRNVHVRYSQYKNLEKRRIGHLWQGRFYSCVLDDAHLWRGIRYVEMNPVRAKIVGNPWDYIWSSTRQHLGIEKSPIVSTLFHEDFKDIGLRPKNWKEYLLEEDFTMVKEMRSKTQKGLAIGSQDFIMKLEEKFAVRLREIKTGRPKGKNKTGVMSVCP